MPKVKGATAAGSADWGKSIVDDLTELRTQIIALLVKLDGEAQIAADYESTLTPAALTTTK